MPTERQKWFSELQRDTFQQTKRETLLRQIQQRGWTLTEAKQRHIAACTDAAMLTRWLDRIVVAASLDELLAE